MVEAIKQYKDGVSGKIFDNECDAIKSELKSVDIKTTFESFYDAPQFNGTEFVNGDFCIQRNKTFYNRLLDGILVMAHKYHPSINSTHSTRNHIKGQTYLGRVLSDSKCQLSTWNDIQMCICPVCYREYGQPYYAINCEHNDSIPSNE